MNWHTMFMGLASNSIMTSMVDELKNARNLTPIKIVLHGPPGAGKTRLAEKLVKHYGIHYVNASTMVKNIMEELVRLVVSNISAWKTLLLRSLILGREHQVGEIAKTSR